ncbi:MAG: hypothetical protein ROR55_10875 [Devosia sp.]
MTELTFEGIGPEHTKVSATLVRDHGDGNVEALDPGTFDRLRRDGHRFFVLGEGKRKRAVEQNNAASKALARSASMYNVGIDDDGLVLMRLE